ncbi:MAG: hypothetical protein ACK5U8_19905 [Deltaproteobacteria bacterium]|jgi:hypothetical protein
MRPLFDHRLAFLLWTLVATSGCPSDPIPSDASNTDVGSADASRDDGGVLEDSGESLDVGAGDSGLADAGSDAPAPTDGGTGTLPPLVPVAELTNASASDYAHNRSGLIEAATLATYATRWATADSAAATAAPNGRPSYLAADARLVVLQLNAANRAAGESFVPSAPSARVYTYLLDEFRFNQTRDTGLIRESVRYQADGPTTDAWLSRYGIDLSRDFVVVASGDNTGSNGSFFQELARAVYWLSYWGADLSHLAIVNGTLRRNYRVRFSS